jgi:thiamine kinase-like enzyme
MTIQPDVIDSLKSLPCFTEIQEISLLTGGLSQTCVKVATAEQMYFAKKLNSKTARGEANAAFACAKQGISPNVIYHDKQWLVTEFFDCQTLAKADYTLDSKVTIALKLMASCHNLSTSNDHQEVPSLDARQTVNALLSNPAPLLSSQGDILDKATRVLSDTIDNLIYNTKSISVLCHGDVNFTNVLLDNSRVAWLIDFECAHRAPIEFDLAMFIAVNDLSANNQTKIIDYYTSLAPSASINLTLLNYYQLYSFYINGLWYIEKDLFSLATTQWLAFDKLACKQSTNLPKLIPLLD